MEEIPTIGSRELRKHLALYLRNETAFFVGNYWRKKALIIPIPEYHRWDERSSKKVIAEIRRKLRLAEEGF